MNTATSHRRRYLLLLLVLLLTPLLAIGCEDESGSDESGGESTSESEASQESEAEESSQAFEEGTPEHSFLEIVDEIAQVLERDDAPAAVAEAVETYYAEKKARILETARTLADKRKKLSPEASEELENELGAQPQATRFFKALDAFRARASNEEFTRVDNVMLEIFEASGQPGAKKKSPVGDVEDDTAPANEGAADDAKEESSESSPQ